MEWCETDLDKFLYGDKEPTGNRIYPSAHGELTDEMMLNFAAQIVEGLAYVHSQETADGKPMCHLDETREPIGPQMLLVKVPHVDERRLSPVNSACSD